MPMSSLIKGTNLEEIYQIYTDMTQEEFRTAAEKVTQEQKEKIL
ncbi:hypothetical protein LCGC14_2363280 [marine sediment metagenome]|uniref:Uncharacterized protein n=1 Tax=marine sediment metagenome TaxID=412755 RepID=A0A0F9EIE2_9ZZZZ